MPMLSSVSRGDVAYARAIALSDELLQHMREASISNDPVRAVMADIWAQHHNVPFMTSVIETVQEAKAGIEQRSEDQPGPPPSHRKG